MNRTRGIGSKKFAGSLVLFLLFAVILAAGIKSRAFENLEAATWDIRLRAVADPRKADQSIKLIVIDQHSLKQMDQLYGFSWPIPRDFYSAVIKFLSRSGAHGLAFDLILSEPSVYGEADDQNLATAFTAGLPLVSALSLDRLEQAASAEIGRLPALQKKMPLPPGLLPPLYNSVLLPIPRLLQAGSELGAVNAIPDPDGVIRRYLLAADVQGRGAEKTTVPGLAAALLLAGAGPDILEQKLTAAAGALADTAGSGPILGYHGPSGSYPVYSISDIIQSWAAIEEGKQPAIKPEQFKDSWVFLGVWAPGLMDQRITPLDPRGRGVDIHAAALDNLVNGGFVRRTGWIASVLAALPFLLLLIAGILFSKRLRLQAVYFTASFSAVVLGSAALARSGIWVDLFVPLIVLALATAAAAGYHYFLEGQHSRFLRRAFQFYVSPEVIDRLVADPEKLVLGGERREVTLFFSDIAGFTSISEKLAPEAVSALLNEYLSLMTDTIQQYRGTVDKYVGDAVVAFWNAPLFEQEHQQLAIEAALECQRRLDAKRRELTDRFGADLQTRIGIHSGVVSVGNFGAKSRFNYTVIGDAANLASRLEGANKIFGSGILVSEAARNGAGGKIVFRKIGRLQVVGREEPLNVYEPIGYRSGWTAQRAADYEGALIAAERGDFAAARSVLEKFADCPAAVLYLKKLADYPCGLSDDAKDPLLIRATEK